MVGRDETLSNIMFEGDWHLGDHYVGRLLANEISQIRIKQNGGCDSWVWDNSPTGLFHTHTAYNQIRTLHTLPGQLEFVLW